jgi:Flp pilus assembly protein TadG
LQRLHRDRSGALALTLSISIAVILGMVGLGPEAGSWYANQRDMQNAADLAAESGINSINSTSSTTAGTITTNAYSEAKSASAIHGFADGTNGVTVTVTTPPTAGSYTASTYLNKALEVKVSKPSARLFSS